MSSELLQLVENAGFANPTEIQARTIPLALKGHDLIASAKTGSGKTAAFSLPMIEKLKGRRGTLGLVLAPTREIALQTLETMKTFGEPLGITSVALIGGTDVKADERALALYPHVIVGTPGRICDHLERGNLWLEFIEHLVLDEADRMLDMGFAKEVNRIVNELPANRQTLLFSATIPPSIDKLCREILHRPERVAIGSALSVNRNVSHEVLWVPEKSRRRELIRFLERQGGTAIVFTKTKDDCTHLWRSIHAAGIHESTYISSNKSQAHREEALEGFKTGRYRVLVATDVAGRGIHVENVGCVVNFGVPEEPEDYIHRVGRTGRKDQQGKAITFATPAEAKKIRRIEEVLKERLPSRYARGLDAESMGQPTAREERPRGRGADRGRSADRSRPARGRHAEPEERPRRAAEERPRRDTEPRAARHRQEPQARHRDAEPRAARHRDAEPARSRHRDEGRPRHRDDAPARGRHREEDRPRHRDEAPPRGRHRDEDRPRHRDEAPVRGRHREEDRPRHRDDAPPRGRHREEERPRHRDEAPRPRHRDDAPRARHRDEEPRSRPRHEERAPRHRQDESRARHRDDEPKSRHRDEPRDRHRDESKPRHRDDGRRPVDLSFDERPRRPERQEEGRQSRRDRPRDEERPPRSEARHRDERPSRSEGRRREDDRPPRRERESDESPRAVPPRDAERDELLALEAEAWHVANEERHPGVWGRSEESPEKPFVHAAWEMARAREAKKPAPRSGSPRGGKAPKGGGSRGGKGRRR